MQPLPVSDPPPASTMLGTPLEDDVVKLSTLPVPVPAEFVANA